MSVNGVGAVPVQPQKKSSVAKKAAIAAGIGATWCAVGEAASQKVMIKNPMFYFNTWKQSLKSKKFMKDMFGKNSTLYKMQCTGLNILKKKLADVGIIKGNAVYKKGIVKGFRNLAMNWKTVAKKGAIGAAIVAGTYLAYKGVKALFTKND